MIFEKIRERLQKGIYSFEERLKYDTKTQRHLLSQNNGINYAINIINQVEAEYNNGWISVDDRLPEYNGKAKEEQPTEPDWKSSMMNHFTKGE